MGTGAQAGGGADQGAGKGAGLDAKLASLSFIGGPIRGPLSVIKARVLKVDV